MNFSLGPVLLSLLLPEPIEVGPGRPTPPPAPGLRFIDVGQGSALLVVGREGHALLIDAGPPAGAEALLFALAEHGVAVVDLWVTTHFDTDHVGGFGRALAGADGVSGTDDDLEVRERWDRGDADLPATAAVAAYFAAPWPRRAVVPGDRWRAPGLEAWVVPAGTAPERAGENDRGLALCLDVEALRMLAPGDLPAEQVAVAAERCGPVDILWASHHGSRTGISQAVLSWADPALVVVSAGADNQFCHPHIETLDLLHTRPVWFTALAGASPHDTCAGVAAHWGDAHHLAGGDIWLVAGSSP